jgi:hypothetical protein
MPAAGENMSGHAVGVSDTPGTSIAWVGPTASTFTLNGGTKGGFIGDRIDLVDAASGTWSAVAFLKQTGTEATPWG